MTSGSAQLNPYGADMAAHQLLFGARTHGLGPVPVTGSRIREINWNDRPARLHTDATSALLLEPTPSGWNMIDYQVGAHAIRTTQLDACTWSVESDYLAAIASAFLQPEPTTVDYSQTRRRQANIRAHQARATFSRDGQRVTISCRHLNDLGPLAASHRLDCSSAVARSLAIDLQLLAAADGDSAARWAILSKLRPIS
jgi:hypothetical protein